MGSPFGVFYNFLWIKFILWYVHICTQSILIPRPPLPSPQVHLYITYIHTFLFSLSPGVEPGCVRPWGRNYPLGLGELTSGNRAKEKRLCIYLSPLEPIVQKGGGGTLWAPPPSRTFSMTFLFVSRMISWRPLINGIPFCCINRGYWWLERLRIRSQKVGIGCKEIISEPRCSRQLCLAK